MEKGPNMPHKTWKLFEEARTSFGETLGFSWKDIIIGISLGVGHSGCFKQITSLWASLGICLKRCLLFGTFDALGARLLCTHHIQKERYMKLEINLASQSKGENEKMFVTWKREKAMSKTNS